MLLGLLDQQQIFWQLYGATTFNRFWASRAVSLNISKAFERVWHDVLFHKLSLNGIASQMFGLISSFLSNRWLRVVLDGKSSQEYPVNAGVLPGSILGPLSYSRHCGLEQKVACWFQCWRISSDFVWFVLWSLFLLRLHGICINLLYGHAWNTVVMSRLVPLVATWNC